jgi:hypothetical protein
LRPDIQKVGLSLMLFEVRNLIRIGLKVNFNVWRILGNTLEPYYMCAIKISSIK